MKFIRYLLGYIRHRRAIAARDRAILQLAKMLERDGYTVINVHYPEDRDR